MTNDMQHSIKHHLTEDLLMAYATGALPEAFSLTIATHISLCDDCRAALMAYESVGGAVMDQGEAAELDADCLSRTMALIAAGPKEPIARTKRDSVFPVPLADYIGGGPDKVKWRSAGGGVKQAILPTAKGAVARLLYIPAGSAVPDHGHRGVELTLVLQGAFKDEEGHFSRGDIEVATESDVHTPIADEGMPCICLAATDAPLRFKGILPRIAQPFLRI